MQQFILVTHLTDRHSALPLFTDRLTSLAHNETGEIAVELLRYLDADLPDNFNELTPKLLIDLKVVEIILDSSEIKQRATLDGKGKSQLIGVLPDFVKERIATLASLLANDSSSHSENRDSALIELIRLEQFGFLLADHSAEAQRKTLTQRRTGGRTAVVVREY